MKQPAILALVLFLAATTLVADAAGIRDGALTGQISSPEQSLPFSKVYAYHLSEQQLTKVVTDDQGNFSFDRLPAGLYKVIAFQDGFVPGIALLTRSTTDAYQFLSMQLAPSEAEAPSQDDGFWAVREKIPADVLRDIENQQQPEDPWGETTIASRWITPQSLETRMEAIAGVDQNLELGEASMAGGTVGIEGEFAQFNVGLTGDFVALQPLPGFGVGGELASGRSQALSVRVENPGTTGVRLSTTNSYLNPAGEARRDDTFVGLERHQVQWTQSVGDTGRSAFSAEYAEENNFFSQAPIEPFGIPDASRFWQVAGSYSTAVTRAATVETGFRFRERQTSTLINLPAALDSYSYLPNQRVDLFGRSGLQINPDVLVEFGLYSTMRDGSLSLSPSGGMVLQLADNWQARARGSFRAYEEATQLLHQDLTPTLFSDNSTCQMAEEYCYRVSLAHESNDQSQISVGVVHRRLAETLHLYFNDDFFSRFESLYLVRGDNLPELQLSASRHLTPKVLARLSSNLAQGGGGILYATPRSSYENQVRYLVTSLDTQFQQTSTGVFVAFHHLAQQLNPVEETLTGRSRRRGLDPQAMEIERLQVMLTQDLDILHSLASDWAVRLNMEVSRGNSTESSSPYADDEYRKRVMGGLTVSF